MVNHAYTFQFDSGFDEATEALPLQTHEQKRIIVSEGSSWRVTLREFTNFLSGIYGYNITEQVFVEDLNWEGETTTVCLRDADL